MATKFFPGLKKFFKRVCHEELVDVSGYPLGSTKCERIVDFAGGYYNIFHEISMAAPGIERDYVGNYHEIPMEDRDHPYRYFASFKIKEA